MAKSPLDTRTSTPLAAADGSHGGARGLLSHAYASMCIVVLFINYFLAQYDKFILSYFQVPFSESLNLSPAQYGVLSGYATGIVYALLALPIAFLADYLPRARVWVLWAASTWWSLCVVFQSLSGSFWQILLARIGMGIGQSCVEALSVSLISDLMGGWRNVFLGESVFYVGVYIGEAVSGQIATAFHGDGDGWRIALRAIGITGLVVAFVLRLVLRDPPRQASVVACQAPVSGNSLLVGIPTASSRRGLALAQLRDTVSYLLRMRSFWILVLSASFRQLAGNVFGYYMPSYLSGTFPAQENLLSRYGIIVGVVGSVAVLTGGALTSLLWNKTKLTPVILTAVGGMLSSPFVLVMIFSRRTEGDDDGIAVLYGSMSVAYLTAELWLGALNGLVALLLPPRYKTFGLSIWASIQVLIYSAGPEIMGLALRHTVAGSSQNLKDTQVALAVIISVCYWIAGSGFLASIPLLRRDLTGDFRDRPISRRKRYFCFAFLAVLAALVISLFVASIVIDAT